MMVRADFWFPGAAELFARGTAKLMEDFGMTNFLLV
jgi:hypothetical protein